MADTLGINIGLIGAGSVVQRVHLPGLKLCPDIRVLAACDSNLDAARATGAPGVHSDYFWRAAISTRSSWLRRTTFTTRL